MQIETLQTDFTSLLNNLSSNDAAVLQAATELVQTMQTDNPGLFALNCSEAYQDNQIDMEQRLTAVEFLTETIRSAGDQGSLWNTLDRQIREKVRENVLKSLALPNAHIRHTAAETIAVIHMTELPLNEENNIIQLLVQGAHNRDPEVRWSAIIALQEIILQFRKKQTDLSMDIKHQLLAGIFAGLKEKKIVDINKRALDALNNFLGFAQDLFDKNNIRNEVLKTLVMLQGYHGQQLALDILQFLEHLVRFNYDLAKYSALEIWKMTANYITDRSLLLSNSALELWRIIAFLEENMDPEEATMIRQVEDFIVPLYVEQLASEKSYQQIDWVDEFEEYGNVARIKDCLRKIAKNSDKAFREYNLDFLSGNFQKRMSDLNGINPIQIGAELYVLSCVLENSQNTEELISQNITTIIDLMDNPAIRVKQEGANVLEIIAKISPHTYFQEPLSSQLLPLSIKLLLSDSKISVRITTAWEYLREYIYYQKIDFDFKEIIEIFLRNLCLNPQRPCPRFISKTSDALRTVFIGNTDMQFKMQYTGRIFQDLKNLKEISDDGFYDGSEIRNAIQEGLTNCLHPLLFRLPIFELQNEGDQMTFFEEAFSVVDMLISKNDHNDKSVTKLLGDLASVQNSIFDSISDKFLSYIKIGLENNEDIRTFMEYLQILAGLVYSGTDKSGNLVPIILEIFRGILFNDDYNNQFKDVVLATLEKMFLGFKEQSLSYADSFNKFYDSALTFATNPDSQDSSFKKLFRNVLQSYFSFFQTLTTHSTDTKYWTLVPKVIECIKSTCQDDPEPNKSYFQDAVDFLRRFSNLSKGTDIENEASQVIEKIPQLTEQSVQGSDSDEGWNSP